MYAVQSVSVRKVTVYGAVKTNEYHYHIVWIQILFTQILPKSSTQLAMLLCDFQTRKPIGNIQKRKLISNID